MMMPISIRTYGRMTQKRSPMMKLYSQCCDGRGPRAARSVYSANAALSISMVGGDGGDGGGDGASVSYLVGEDSFHASCAAMRLSASDSSIASQSPLVTVTLVPDAVT